MNRRNFLAGAAAVAVAPILPAIDPVEARHVHRVVALAPAAGVTATRGGAMTAAALRAELVDGLNHVFSEEYAKYPGDWDQVFR